MAYDEWEYEYDEGDYDEGDSYEEPEYEYEEPSYEYEEPYSYEEPSYEYETPAYDEYEAPAYDTYSDFDTRIAYSPSGYYEGGYYEPQGQDEDLYYDPARTTGGFATWDDFYRQTYGDRDVYDYDSGGRIVPDQDPERGAAITTWADGTPMDEKARKQARAYQVGLENGLDDEGSRVLVAVTETEAGLFGALGDRGQSRGPYQFYEGGQMPNFRRWLAENNIQGDPNVLVHDVDLATAFAAQNYLGNTIRQGQAQGLHGADLATYAQRRGQVSVNPEKTGANYQRLFAQGDPYGEALAAAVPDRGSRQRANEALPAGHFDGDGHKHGVATPYTQQQVDRAGNVWTIAFDYDQPYDQPFNPDIPNHRGVDLQPTGVDKGGMNLPYTPFRSGRVVEITNDEHGGIGIIVDTGDPNARYDRYFHNNAVSVRRGDYVEAGRTPLGLIGQTGSMGFPHLHYEVSQDINGDPAGQTIDPRPYISNRPVQPGRTTAVPPPTAPRIEELATPYTSGRRAQTTGIVIHSTRGGNADPQQEYEWTKRWFGSNPNQVSANAVIGPDGTIAMPRDWDLVTHHAGENNRTMFGIELVQARPEDPYTDAQYDSLRWLLGQVSQRYNLPLTRQTVRGHEELEQGRRSGKTDPGANFDWDRALAPSATVERRVAYAPAQAGAAQPRQAAPPREEQPLPPETQRALTEWQAWRRSRGEDPTDLPEFRAHLDRLGAPDPWAPRYIVGGREVPREEYDRSVAESTRARQEFVDSLDPGTRQNYLEFEAYKKARNEPITLAEFRTHLGNVGAPDPWTRQEQAAQAAAAQRTTVAAAPAAPPPAGTRPVYRLPDGTEISEAEAQRIEARNAEITRQNAAIEGINANIRQRNAAAQVERERLRTWQQQSEAWATDPNGQLPHPGPRPSTENLDWVEAQGAQALEAGPREQPIPISTYNEPLSATEVAAARARAEAPIQSRALAQETLLSQNPQVQQAVAATARSASLLEQVERQRILDRLPPEDPRRMAIVREIELGRQAELQQASTPPGMETEPQLPRVIEANRTQGIPERVLLPPVAPTGIASLASIYEAPIDPETGEPIAPPGSPYGEGQVEVMTPRPDRFTTGGEEVTGGILGQVAAAAQQTGANVETGARDLGSQVPLMIWNPGLGTRVVRDVGHFAQEAEDAFERAIAPYRAEGAIRPLTAPDAVYNPALETGQALSNLAQLGFIQARRGVLDTAAETARVFGLGSVADYFQGASNQLTSYLHANPALMQRQTQGSLREGPMAVAEGIVGSLPSIAPTVLAAAMSFGPGKVRALGTALSRAGLAVNAMASAGGQLQDLRDEVAAGRISPERAALISLGGGIMEIATERLFPGADRNLLDGMAARTAKEFYEEMAQRGLLGVGRGLLREGSQEAVEEAVAEAYGVAVDTVFTEQRPTLLEMADRIGMAAVVGGVSGAMVSAPFAAAEATRVRQQQQEAQEILAALSGPALGQHGAQLPNYVPIEGLRAPFEILADQGVRMQVAAPDSSQFIVQQVTPDGLQGREFILAISPQGTVTTRDYGGEQPVTPEALTAEGTRYDAETAGNRFATATAALAERGLFTDETSRRAVESYDAYAQQAQDLARAAAMQQQLPRAHTIPENRAGYTARRAANGETNQPHEALIPPAQWRNAETVAGTAIPYYIGAHVPQDLAVAMRDDPVNTGITAMAAAGVAYADRIGREAGVLPAGEQRTIASVNMPGVNALNDNRGAYNARTGVSSAGQYQVNAGQIVVEALARTQNVPVRIADGRVVPFKTLFANPVEVRHSPIFARVLTKVILEQVAHELPHDIEKGHNAFHDTLLDGFYNTLLGHAEATLARVQEWQRSGAIDTTLQTYGQILAASPENPEWQDNGRNLVAALAAERSAGREYRAGDLGGRPGEGRAGEQPAVGAVAPAVGGASRIEPGAGVAGRAAALAGQPAAGVAAGVPELAPPGERAEPGAAPSPMEALPPPDITPPAIVEQDTREPLRFPVAVPPRAGVVPRFPVQPQRLTEVPAAAGPPLLSDEDAIDQGWVGIPDPRVPIADRVDLHNRLAMTPFISQRELIALLGNQPEDLQQVVEFMLDQRAKVVEGRLLPSDVAKAYFMTVSSIGQGAVSAERIRDRTGLVIPEHFLYVNQQGVRQIRPEDAAAAWLASPTGQRALAALDQGLFDQEAWAQGAAIRAAFSDDRLNQMNVMGARPARPGQMTMRDIPALTAELNRIGDNPRALGNAIVRLNGIGRQKLGFIAHLLGFGERPTIDARAVNTWITGQGDIRGLDTQAGQVARAINQHLGSNVSVALVIARIIAGYNRLRRSGYAPDIPGQVYNAVLHGWLWSKVKNLPGMYAPVYEAQAAPVRPIPGLAPLPGRASAYRVVDGKLTYTSGGVGYEVTDLRPPTEPPGPNEPATAVPPPAAPPTEVTPREGQPWEVQDWELERGWHPARFPGWTAEELDRARIELDPERGLYKPVQYDPNEGRPSPMVAQPVALMLPVPARQQWPEVLVAALPGARVEPGVGLILPATAAARGPYDVDRRAARGVVYTPLRGAPTGRAGEQVLRNPLFYRGGAEAADHARQVAQVLGEAPDWGDRLLETVVGQLAQHGPTVENVTSLLGTLGLGDPTQAPLLIAASHGRPGHRPGGLADRIVSHLLSFEGRARGFDGVVAYDADLGPSEAAAFEGYSKRRPGGYRPQPDGTLRHTGEAALPGYQILDGQPVFTEPDGQGAYAVEDGRLVARDGQAPSFLVSRAQALATEVPVEIPDDPAFRAALAKSKFVVTPHGIDADLTRWQKPHLAGQPTLQSATFYSPASSRFVGLYQGAQGWGGEQEISGPTTLRRPFVARAGPAGKLGNRVLQALIGRDAPDDIDEAMAGIWESRDRDVRVAAVRNALTRFGGDVDLAETIVDAGADNVDVIAFSVRENVAANALRAKGYDSAIGYQDSINEVTEVIDAREIAHPIPGAPGILHPQFQPVAPSAMAAMPPESPEQRAARQAAQIQAATTWPEGKQARNIAELGLSAKQMDAWLTAQVAAHIEGNGSTFHPRQGNLAGQALYSVSLYPELGVIYDQPPTVQQLESFIRRHRVLLTDGRLSVGTWFNERTATNPDGDNKHYLDIAVTIPDRALAEQLGGDYNQWAIYGLGLPADQAEISTGGDGTVPRVLPPIETRLPLRGDAEQMMRERLAGQAELAAGGTAPEWWEREYGLPFAGLAAAFAEAGETARPLEAALRQSAAESPDGLAHLDKTVLGPFMRFSSPTLRLLGSGIGTPMSTDDTRKVIQFGMGRGWGDWYRIYGQHLAQFAPGITPEEAITLFAHYSSQLSPRQAMDATLATAIAARDTAAFDGLTKEQAQRAIFGVMDTVGITKPTISADDANGAKKLYESGFKVQSQNSWKTATFHGAIMQGRIPSRLDVGYTGDVQAQRAHGYMAFHPTAAQKKAARAQGQEPIDWQNRTMSDAGAWQYMGTIGRWVAGELGIPVSDAQAALWVAGQRAVVPLDKSNLNGTRAVPGFKTLNPNAPVFTDPAKLAQWTQIAQDIKDGKTNVGEQFDALNALGVFDLEDPAALPNLMKLPSYVNGQRYWAQNGYAQKSYPGRTAMDEGLRYEARGDRPWLRAGPIQGALSPLHARALEEAPTLVGVPFDTNAEGTIDGLAIPHVVVDHNDQAGVGLTLPSLNAGTSEALAQRVADASGQAVTLLGAPRPGQAGNALQITLDAVAAPGLPRVRAQVVAAAQQSGAQVIHDPRQVRMFWENINGDQARQTATELYDLLQSHGINADAIKVGTSHVRRFEPGRGSETTPRGGVREVGPGGGSADDHRVAAITEAVARGAAGVGGGPGPVSEPGPVGTVSPGHVQAAVPGLNQSPSYLVARAAALQIPRTKDLPGSVEFLDALSNAGGQIDEEEGVTIPVIRHQKPEQAGQPLWREASFYAPQRLPEKVGNQYDPTNPFWQEKYVGGEQQDRGDLLLRNPLVIRGWALEAGAWEVLQNREDGTPDGQSLPDDLARIERRLPGWEDDSLLSDAALQRVYEGLREVLPLWGVEPEVAREITEYAPTWAEIKAAVMDLAVARYARNAGYDSVIVLTPSDNYSGLDSYISEVVDLRPAAYPVPGTPDTIRPEFAPGRRPSFLVSRATAMELPIPARTEWPPQLRRAMENAEPDAQGNRPQIVPGVGAVFPSAIRNMRPEVTGLEVPRGVVYYRLDPGWRPTFYGADGGAKGAGGEARIVGEHVFRNPLVYQGGDRPVDHVRQLAQIIGPPQVTGQPTAWAKQFTADIRRALAEGGVTAENAAAILTRHGLGDPAVAPELMRSVSGVVAGHRIESLTGLLVTHMLGHEGRARGYDGVITYNVDSDGRPYLTEGVSFVEATNPDRAGRATLHPAFGGGPSFMAGVPPDPALAERAVKRFGLTDDPTRASYVLPDGRMLNGYRGSRRIEHRDIAQAYDRASNDRVIAAIDRDRMTRYSAHIDDFQRQTGALRWVLDDRYLVATALGPLSPAQQARVLGDAERVPTVIFETADGVYGTFEMPDDREALGAAVERSGAPSAMASLPTGYLDTTAATGLVQNSPTLLAQAAESTARLHDALVRAIDSDPLMTPEDRQVVEGFARFYTSAVIGLAANDQARLDTVGLTIEDARRERERALDALEQGPDGDDGITALYTAEAAWATLYPPDDPTAVPPSAMQGLAPSAWKEPFYSRLLQVASALPDQIAPIYHEAAPARIVRRATQARGQVPPAASGLTVDEEGNWVKPATTGTDVQRSAGDQALEQLAAAGAKPDEIAWTGLKGWLAEQGDRPLTRDEIVAYLDQNRIRLDETLFGERPPLVQPLDWREAVDTGSGDRMWMAPGGLIIGQVAGFDNYVASAPSGYGYDESIGMYDSLEEAQAAAEEHYRRYLVPKPASTPGRYAQYTLPGGEQYRELLMTLPVRETMDDRVRIEEQPGGGYRLAEYDSQGRFAGYVSGRYNQRQAAAMYREKYLSEYWDRRGAQPQRAYRGPHWGTPNVLVHVRFNERLGPDGKRVLFIEEIQSDWHQTGRKVGYQRDADVMQQRYRELGGSSPDMRALQEQGLWDEYRDLREKLRLDASAGTVPNAPFETTAQWTRLAFRRMIRWAAEQGFERIAWTTGEQQNQRYALSNDIRTVTYNPDTQHLRAYPRNHQAGPIEHANISLDALPQYIGQAYADALLARPRNQDGYHTLSGLEDVRLQNTGMERYYDQALVNVANELGEPWGVRAGMTTIPTVGEVPSYVVLDRRGTYIAEYESRAEAEEELADRPGGRIDVRTAPSRGPAEQEVHAMDLPDQMRRSALGEGQPLFMRATPPSWLREDPTPVWDEATRPEDELDPNFQEALDQAAAAREIADPEALPRTDGPHQIPLILPGPGDEPSFMAAQGGWAGRAPGPIGEWGQQPERGLDLSEIFGPGGEMLDLPSLPEPAAAAPPVGPPGPPGPPSPPDIPSLGPPSPEEPDFGQFPEWARGSLEWGSLMGPDDLPPTTGSGREVWEMIAAGPNAQDLTKAETNALAGAIWNQFRKAKEAIKAAGASGASAWRVTQAIEQGRRYTALERLAKLPQERWGELAAVWASSPLSEGGDLEAFFQARQAAIDAGDRAEVERLEREGIARAAALVEENTPRWLGRPKRGRTPEESAILTYGDALARATEQMSPGRLGDTLAQPDLSVSKTEFLVAARYNNMLIGPRGILNDYLTNTGMLFGKMLADPFLPEAGGLDLGARAAITRAEYAALKRFWPLAMARMGNQLARGVADSEADVGGTPRNIAGRFRQRRQDAAEEGRRRDRALLLGAEVGSIVFAEAAGRLKGMADVGIKTLAFGAEMTRQAAILAWRQGEHEVDSDAWHQRVHDIILGRNLHPDAKTNTVMYQEMRANAMREAERTVFQGKMGTVGRMLEPIQRHPLGQVVLPFLRTLYHIRGWAVDLSPVGWAVTLGDVMRAKIYQAEMRSEGGRTTMAETRNMRGLLGGPYAEAYRGHRVGPAVADLDRRMMSNAIGLGMFFWLVGLAFQGALSASGPPEDDIVWLDDDAPDGAKYGARAALMAQGWQPYSIRIPWFNGKHYWVSYQQWGPLGYVMALAAITGEAYKYGTAAGRTGRGERSDWRLIAAAQGLHDLATQADGDTFASVGRRLTATLSDISFLGGFMDLLGLTQDAYQFWVPPGPETPGEATRRQHHEKAELQGWAAWTLASVLPSGMLLRTIAQSEDPWTRATDYGDFREALAANLPDLWGAMPGLPGDPYGSTTGRRQGLAIKHDALGRPIPNQYEGVYAWLPFRATAENLSSDVINVLVDAQTGAASPPRELIYKPPNARGAWINVTIPQSTRESLAADIGRASEARVRQEMAAVPEAQRLADPAAWSDRLKKAMSEVYFEQKKAAEARPEIVTLLADLAKDSERTRPFESKAFRDSVLNPGGATEPTGGGSTTTAPAPTPGPDLDTINRRRRETGLPEIPTTTAPVAPAPSATPRPSTAPTVAPAPTTGPDLDTINRRRREIGLPELAVPAR